MNIFVRLAKVSESHLESWPTMPLRCYTAAADRTRRSRRLGNGSARIKKGGNRGPIRSVMRTVHLHRLHGTARSTYARRRAGRSVSQGPGQSTRQCWPRRTHSWRRRTLLHPGISVFRPAELGICDRAYRESHAAGRQWGLGKPSRKPLGLPAIPPFDGDSYLSFRPLRVRPQQSCHN